MRRVEAAVLLLLGSLASAAVRHDYDPVSDAVASWTVRAGESVGQRLRSPPVMRTIRGFRMKMLRDGDAPALEYRIGKRWGGQEIASGRLEPSAIAPFFGRWYGAALPKPAEVESGSVIYLALRASAGGNRGHYEVFGTATGRVHRAEFQLQFQFIPNWGAPAALRDDVENPFNIYYGTPTTTYAGGKAIGPDGT